MDELLDILEDVKPEVDFEKETGLIDNSILDSFDIVQIVMKLNEAFDIEIGAEDIIPQAMWAMVQKLQG